ncbi:MAG: hypothetical protein Q8N26_15930 [Myxococcales bacterium]|nr:hypothetical protein [Myxococcales bacterium]
MSGRAWWLTALVLAGCPKAPVVDPIDASVAELDAGVDAGVDAGTEPLGFTIDLETTDAGVITGLDAGAMIEPIRAITLTFPTALDDVRFRVMDWTDSVVPSDDESTVDGGLTYRIVFVQPLKTGRGYSLLIDAETNDTFSDTRGHQYDELRIPFRVAGDVQPEPGAPVKKKKRKK